MKNTEKQLVFDAIEGIINELKEIEERFYNIESSMKRDRLKLFQGIEDKARESFCKPKCKIQDKPLKDVKIKYYDNPSSELLEYLESIKNKETIDGYILEEVWLEFSCVGRFLKATFVKQSSEKCIDFDLIFR